MLFVSPKVRVETFLWERQVQCLLTIQPLLLKNWVFVTISCGQFNFGLTNLEDFLWLAFNQLHLERLAMLLHFAMFVKV